MTNKLLLSIVVLIFATIGLIPPVLAADEIATVTQLRNTAFVFREGRRTNISEGFKIKEYDEIHSEDEARIELTFIDGTKLYIGANARIVIDEFLFDPDENVGIAILRSLEGAFRFITGNIGKVEQPQVVVQSRFGVIGVRGTDFWAGPSRGVYGVLLLDGSISVTNPAGQRILTVPGTGVNLTENNVPPSEVTVWGANRAEEALASVAF